MITFILLIIFILYFIKSKSVALSIIKNKNFLIKFNNKVAITKLFFEPNLLYINNSIFIRLNKSVFKCKFIKIKGNKFICNIRNIVYLKLYYKDSIKLEIHKRKQFDADIILYKNFYDIILDYKMGRTVLINGFKLITSNNLKFNLYAHKLNNIFVKAKIKYMHSIVVFDNKFIVYDNNTNFNVVKSTDKLNDIIVEQIKTNNKIINLYLQEMKNKFDLKPVDTLKNNNIFLVLKQLYLSNNWDILKSYIISNVLGISINNHKIKFSKVNNFINYQISINNKKYKVDFRGDQLKIVYNNITYYNVSYFRL